MTEFEERARELGRRFGSESETEMEHELDIVFSQALDRRELLERIKDVCRKHGGTLHKID